MNDCLQFEQKFVDKVYTNISSQFDKTRYKIWDTTKLKIKMVMESITSPVTVLELGCGNGRNLEAIRNFYGDTRLIGIEPCPELYNIIKTKNFDTVVNCGHFSPELNNFKGDIVLSIAVIHHLSTRERRIEAIKELVEMTNSYVIIQVMAVYESKTMNNWVDYGNNDFLIPWVRTGDMRYYHLFESGELESLIDLSKVQIVESFSDRSNYGVVLKRN